MMVDATAVLAVSSLLRTSTKAAVAAEGACWTIVVLLGSGGIVAAPCRTIAMLLGSGGMAVAVAEGSYWTMAVGMTEAVAEGSYWTMADNSRGRTEPLSAE